MNTENDLLADVGEDLEVGEDISDLRRFDYLSLAVFWLLFGIVALQFITRYVFNDSLGWTEEIARYFLIVMGFVGAVACVRKGKHIYLEFFYRYLSPAVLKPVVVVSELIVASFWGYAAILCVELAQRTKQSMVSIALPKSVIYYVVVVACALMAVYAVINLITYARTNSKDLYAQKVDLS